MIKKYGLANDLKRRKFNKKINNLNELDELNEVDDKSSLNNLLDEHQLIKYDNHSLNLISNKLSTKLDPFETNYLMDSDLLDTISLSTKLNSKFPNSNLPILKLPDSLSKATKEQINLTKSLSIYKSEFLEDYIDKELILDEQINLLLSSDDRLMFNFYRNEFQINNISLNFFVLSISRLLNTPEKVNFNFNIIRYFFMNF